LIGLVDSLALASRQVIARRAAAKAGERHI
jgi:hypothetical protein